MLRISSRIVLAVLALLLCSRAAGQTSRPSDDAGSADASAAGDWPLVVRRFAEAICADPASAAPTIRPLVTSSLTVRRFDGGGSQLSDLTDNTAGATLVSARGYLAPAASMASDIADDASNCAAVPEETKRALTPADNEARRRANATAARWIASVLEAAAGQPVGVVVHWTVDPGGGGDAPANADAASPNRRILIILVKGQLGTDGKYRIRQIVYGNAKQATQ